MSSSSWSARECADASIRWSMARNNVRRRWYVDDADVAHLTRRCRRVGARHVLHSETKSVCVREAPARRYAPRRSLTLQQCSTHLRHHWHARIIRVESQLTVQKSRRTAAPPTRPSARAEAKREHSALGGRSSSASDDDDDLEWRWHSTRLWRPCSSPAPHDMLSVKAWKRLPGKRGDQRSFLKLVYRCSCLSKQLTETLLGWDRAAAAHSSRHLHGAAFHADERRG